MCLWMDQKVADRLPNYADHFVGVGGVVINEHRQILMIQENRAKGNTIQEKKWKLPGGLVDPGETIKVAAEREVLEETGVKSNFVGILAMREQMDYKWGAADMYFGCVLRAFDENIQVQDTQEVFNADWIPLDEITTNEEGSSKYMLYPNAFKYVS